MEGLFIDLAELQWSLLVVSLPRDKSFYKQMSRAFIATIFTITTSEQFKTRFMARFS